MPTYTMIQARDRIQSIMAGVQAKHNYTLSMREVRHRGRDSIEVVYRYRGSRFGDLQRMYGSSYKSAYDAKLLNNAPSIVEHENAFKGESSKQCVLCCACMSMPLCFACIYFTCFDQFKEAIGVTSEDYIVEAVENLIRRGDVWVEDSLKEYDARYGRQALFELVVPSGDSGAERKDDSLGPHVAASEKTLLPGGNVASYGT